MHIPRITKAHKTGFGRRVGIILALVFAVFLLVRKEGVHEPEKALPVPQKTQQLQTQNIISTTKPMYISSSAFKDNEHIPYQYTCDGKNTNPSFAIADVPTSAKSLAFIMDDPDAPGGEWVHWILWNIDPATVEISEHSVPSGAVEGVTDFKKPGYGGPCPPDGLHRYFFKLYALDAKLDLPQSAAKADLEKAMQGHIVSQAQTVGLYARGY